MAMHGIMLGLSVRPASKNSDPVSEQPQSENDLSGWARAVCNPQGPMVVYSRDGVSSGWCNPRLSVPNQGYLTGEIPGAWRGQEARSC